MHNDLCDLTVAGAASLISNKELSPVELTQAILNRIDDVGDKLSAFVSVHHEEALEIAKAAEAMMKVGYRLGPLHGVPIAIKDNISLAGRVTSAGSKILADKTAANDSEVVRRLKGAGANLLANTNMHEFAVLGLLNIRNTNQQPLVVGQGTEVCNLTAHFSIKRRMVKYDSD